MPVGILTLELHLPGCNSLKEKRSQIKPLLSRLHREFNISIAEVNQQDLWRSAVLACAWVSNDSGYTQKALQEVLHFIKLHYPDLPVQQYHLEIIQP